MVKNRILWIDVLNICACLSVLLLHTNFQYLSYDGNITFSWLYGCIIFTIAFWAVPVFIMLSVCKIVNYSGGVKSFYRKRLSKIGIPFLFWNVIYAIIYYLQSGSFTWQEGVDMFIHGTFNRYMWFFTPLFGLYLSMPFLKVFVQNASYRLIWLYIAFGFIFESLLPFIFDIAGINYYFIGNDYKQPAFFAIASNFVYIGILGYMLTHVEIPRKCRLVIYIVGIITAIIHFCFLFLGTILIGKVVRIELNYFYPSSVLIPAAVLVFFRYTKWDNFFKTEKVKHLIETLSGCCLGVYLIQRLLQIIFGYYNLPGVNYLSGFVVLFILGVLITCTMKKLPILKNCV